jgi:hypothetical protein
VKHRSATRPGEKRRSLRSELATFLLQRGCDLRRRVPQLALEPVVAPQPLEQRDRVPVGRAVPQAHDREPPDGLVVVGAREPVQLGTHRVDRARAVAREQLERDQGRAAARRALVVEAPCEELDLLAKAKLADGPVGDGTLAVVRAPRRTLDLVLPAAAQVGQLALVALFRESVCSSGCLLKGQESPFRERGSGPT